MQTSTTAVGARTEREKCANGERDGDNKKDNLSLPLRWTWFIARSVFLNRCFPAVRFKYTNCQGKDEDRGKVWGLFYLGGWYYVQTVGLAVRPNLQRTKTSIIY